MKWISVIILFIVVTVYVLLGATVFHFMEHPREEELKSHTRLSHLSFLSNNTCLDHDDLEKFVQRVLEAQKNGVIATANFTTEPNWDFFSSVFFSTTVITTIGYGNIAPSTLGGQVFCVFYALCGIPLCTVLLASLGQKMRDPVARLQQFVIKGKSKTIEKCFKLTFCFVCGCVIFIFLPSLMFTKVEGWHYGVSVYYCVITLTTIGFGDYIAGLKAVPHRNLYRIAEGLWVLFGLSWLALMIGESVGDLTDRIKDKEKRCRHRQIENKTGENIEITDLKNTPSSDIRM